MRSSILSLTRPLHSLGQSLVVVMALNLLSAPPARAGVLDSPLPVFQGKPSKLVFLVPGVMHNGTLVTLFSCVSLEKNKTFWIGTQVFPKVGGDPENVTGGSGVGVGTSITMGTGTATGYQINAFINIPESNNPRSARILGTSAKIMCSAYVVDTSGTGTAYSLPVIKRVQKGD